MKIVTIKNLSIVLLSLVISTTAMATSVSCKTLLANHQWFGTAEQAGVPVVIENLSFNQNVTEMTTVDNKDPGSITIPVQVTCNTPLNFELTDTKSKMGHLYLQGNLQPSNNNYSLKFKGTKTMNGKTYQVSMDLTSK